MDAINQQMNIYNPLTPVDFKGMTKGESTLSKVALVLFCGLGRVYLSAPQVLCGIAFLSLINQITDRKVSRVFGALFGVVKGVGVGCFLTIGLVAFNIGLFSILISNALVLRSNRAYKAVFFLASFLVAVLHSTYYPLISARLLFMLISSLASIPYIITGARRGFDFKMELDLPEYLYKYLYQKIPVISVVSSPGFFVAVTAFKQAVGECFPLGKLSSRVSLASLVNKVIYPIISSVGQEPLHQWKCYLEELKGDITLPAKWGGLQRVVKLLSCISEGPAYELLDFTGEDPNEVLDRHEYAMIQISSYFNGLEAEARKEGLMKFAHGLEYCSTGKRENIWQYYQLLISERKIKNLTDSSIVEDRGPDVTAVLALFPDLAQDIQRFVEAELGIESEMMQQLTDKDGLHGQLSHDKLFILNSVAKQFGFDYQLDYDINVAVCNKNLLSKSREAIAEIILPYVEKYAKRYVKKRVDEELAKEKSTAYSILDKIMDPRNDNWCLSSGVQITESGCTNLLEKIGFLRAS